MLRLTFVILFAGMLLLTLGVQNAFAQGAYQGVKSRCQQVLQEVQGADQDGAFIVEYVVTCTKTVLEEVFQQMIDGFYPLVETAIGASLTLAVVLFGVLLLTGMVEKSSRDTFIALFKLSCVLMFVQPEVVTQIYHMGIDSMDGLTDLVFQFGKGNGTNGKCYDNATLWDRLDCMLDILIGTVKSGGAGGGAAAGAAIQGVSRGIQPMNMAYLASSGVGALVGLIGMYVIVTMLFAALKSIHTYLAAIMGLSFILVFAPLFVPMIMFKSTRGFFDHWQRIATSFVLQPVILFGFLSLMLIALEDMLVENNGSFLKMTCGQQCAQRDQFPYPSLLAGQAIGVTGHWNATCFGPASEKKYATHDFGAFGDKTMYDPRGDAANFIDKNCTGNGQRFEEVKHDKAAGLSGSGDETRQQERAALSAITLALTAFVFVSMLNYIPTLATELSGGLYEVPNLYDLVGSKLPGGDQANKMIGGFTQKFKDRAAGMFGNR